MGLYHRSLPSPRYLTLPRKGARAHGSPDHRIGFLDAVRHAGRSGSGRFETDEHGQTGKNTHMARHSGKTAKHRHGVRNGRLERFAAAAIVQGQETAARRVLSEMFIRMEFPRASRD